MQTRRSGYVRRGLAAPPLKLVTLDESEDELHKSVRALLDIALLPPAVWTTFPAGMYQLAKTTGGRLKAYGLKEGIPDIMLLYDGRVMWIELKRRSGRISTVQRTMHERLERAGTPVYVCRSSAAVADALAREGFPILPGIVRSLLAQGPYQPAERQSIGDPDYGQTHSRPKARQPAQPATRQASP